MSELLFQCSGWCNKSIDMRLSNHSGLYRFRPPDETGLESCERRIRIPLYTYVAIYECKMYHEGIDVRYSVFFLFCSLHTEGRDSIRHTSTNSVYICHVSKCGTIHMGCLTTDGRQFETCSARSRKHGSATR